MTPDKADALRPRDAVAVFLNRCSGYLRKLGPGLITGASDDDPSGIATYAIAGASFGYGLLWLALITAPMMIAVQEMCARIGMVTGTGLIAAMRRVMPVWLLRVLVALVVGANTLNVAAESANRLEMPLLQKAPHCCLPFGRQSNMIPNNRLPQCWFQR